MIKCGADILVRDSSRYWCCAHADRSVRAKRASGNAVRSKEITE